MNASKGFSLTEHLVNNHDCASNYSLKRFKVIKNSFNIFNLIKLEAISTLINKLKLFEHEDFNYNVCSFCI